MSAPSRIDTTRVIRSPRGSELSCKSWLTEAAFRMIQNNLDPDVAENPSALVVYGGIGRAARNWECFDAILRRLRELNDDETLLIQSGKPVGVFKTHQDAPRVLLANSNLVPHWATWEHFNELDKKGLMMYGQMTAGSWIYIGSQGIVQGTYETFVEMGRQHYGGSLKGKWILTAGLGGMGGAQPLAASLAGACSLNIECQQDHIDMRLRTRYVDEQARDLDDALARVAKYMKADEAKSIALLGNAAEMLPELVKRGVKPDAVTDQTSAHDPVNGYLPIGWTVEQWFERRKSDPDGVRDAAKHSMRVHVEAMLAFQKMGVPTFDYGNNIRQMAKDEGLRRHRAGDQPGSSPRRERLGEYPSSASHRPCPDGAGCALRWRLHQWWRGIRCGSCELHQSAFALARKCLNEPVALQRCRLTARFAHLCRFASQCNGWSSPRECSGSEACCRPGSALPNHLPAWHRLQDRAGQ